MTKIQKYILEELKKIIWGLLDELDEKNKEEF